MLKPQTWADLGIDVPPHATGEYATTCPMCSRDRRKNPKARCLSANVERRVWHCNHCGWSGALGEDPRFVEPAWRRPQYRKPEPTPTNTPSDRVTEWFAARGITPEVLERNQVGALSVYMPQLEQHAEAIVFPYRRNGELINRKYRTRDKHFRMDTGAERILYGLDDIAETVVIVEGEIDKLSLEVAGITSSVSVPDGAPAPGSKDYSSKFTFLDSAEETLRKVKRFVIAVDADPPGQLLEDELARRLGRERCLRVKWPTDCKDANDVLVKHGATDLRWFVDNAEPFPIDGVFTMLGESDKVLALYHTGLECGVSTGWLTLDRHYTVRAGEFTVITGTPGSGKSNFLDALIVNLAEQHGWSFGVFSPENQPIHDHMARIAEKYVRRPFSDGPTPRMSEQELELAMRWGESHFFWMLPADEAEWSIEWILSRAKELVFRHGIRGLVIDPWNELEAQRHPHETETEYVSRVLRVARQFGRRHGVHVFIVVHPTKLYRDKESGQYPVPTLYDCSGSAHWRNKADNGLCVWRDLSADDSAEVDIHIQKIRFRQIGHLGKVTLYYDKATARYSTVASLETIEDRYANER
jgi:twinkle protein